MSGNRDGESYWDDDQRMALGRSHGRTMASLEEAAYDYDADQTHKKPTSISPKDQILPSVQEIQTEVEEAKRRAIEHSKIVKDERSGENYHVLSYKKFSQFVSDDAPEDASELSSPSCSWSRRRVSLVLCAVAVLVAASIVLILPTTRNAIDKTLSNIVDGTQAALVAPSGHSRSSQELFQTGSLRYTMHRENGNRTVDFENLYSPSYYPVTDTVPVLWQIPNSGGNTVRDILAYCLSLTFADERGANMEEQENLQIITGPDNIAHYVNVDMASLHGIDRAERLGLIDSALSDAIATFEIAEASKLFQTKFKTGRLFAVLQNPVKRAVTDFITERAFNADVQNMRLYQYAQSIYVRENIVVKEIANVTGAVSSEDVLTAKAMLENYVIVGLWDRLEESMNRFYGYFGWMKEGEWQTCQSNFLAVLNYQAHGEEFANDSDEYETLADRNWADMELYKFALELFSRQAALSASST